MTYETRMFTPRTGKADHRVAAVLDRGATERSPLVTPVVAAKRQRLGAALQEMARELADARRDVARLTRENERLRKQLENTPTKRSAA